MGVVVCQPSHPFPGQTVSGLHVSGSGLQSLDPGGGLEGECCGGQLNRQNSLGKELPAAQRREPGDRNTEVMGLMLREHTY